MTGGSPALRTGPLRTGPLRTGLMRSRLLMSALTWTGLLRTGLRRRRELLADDRGSLPLALLIIAIGMALGAAILPTLIVQDRATVFDNTRMDNLGAAESGIEVIAGRIRAATLATGAGNSVALPCATTAAPITGAVNGNSNATYTATVSYFVNDPVANPPPPKGTNQPMVCTAGAGVYDTASGSFVPSYALIVSVGTDGSTATNGGSAGRTVTSTYVFQTSNRNVPGGVIRIYPSGSANWCMDAGGSPIPGTPITLQVCSTTTPPIAEQLFSYRSDLTLQLSPTTTPTYPNGLCLDTDVTSGAPASGNAIVLQPCHALGNPPYDQQWSFNDSGGFTASVPTSVSTGTLSPYCIAVGGQSLNQPVILGSCSSGGTSSPTEAWLPAPTVGDGAAAAPQLVNYQQFGRCVDVTGQNVDAVKLIAYPCKQNPHPGSVTWNQLFTFNALGQLATPTGYCLFSPRTEGGFVRVTQCANPGYVAGVTAGQLIWTQPGSTLSTPYSQRYSFVDSSTDATRCLGIAAPLSGDNSPWYYITVSTCNGSTAQKWNGDPNLGLSVFQNQNETH